MLNRHKVATSNMYVAKISQKSKTTRIEKFQMGTFVCSEGGHGDQRWLIKAARLGVHSLMKD